MLAHKESGLQAGGKFALVPLDVGDKKQVDSFLSNLPKDLNKIDVLGKPVHDPSVALRGS